MVTRSEQVARELRDAVAETIDIEDPKVALDRLAGIVLSLAGKLDGWPRSYVEAASRFPAPAKQ